MSNGRLSKLRFVKFVIVCVHCWISMAQYIALFTKTISARIILFDGYHESTESDMS